MKKSEDKSKGLQALGDKLESIHQDIKEWRLESASDAFLATTVYVTVAGVAVGAFVGLAGVPVLAAWAGTHLATAAVAGTAAATAGNFLGVSAVGWVGGILGLGAGVGASMIPISRKTIPAKIDYVLKDKILGLDMEAKVESLADGRIVLRPQDFPKLAVKTQAETHQTKARAYEIPTVVGGIGVGLAGLFAGAALGTVAAVGVKLKDMATGSSRKEHDSPAPQ